MRRWFEDAVGGLKWRPDDFWEATPAEFFGAIKGHNRANSGPEEEKMTRAEFEDLEARYLTKDGSS